jgi:hypothetical protein
MNTTRKAVVVILPVALLLADIPGCGTRKPGVLPVTGVVTLNGKPVANAAVMLMPSESRVSELPASGITDQQGGFKLTTTNVGPGAIPGNYGVTVIKKETSGSRPDTFGLSSGIAAGGIQEKWIIPKKYSTPNESGLKVEVKPGLEPLRLELQSP